ncbi:MAG: MraY family glycosyltransferase [Gammaproteobacteria bacterium]|nr:MraY family glycosyltransferase [Gammaproteobacteria bacterium]
MVFFVGPLIAFAATVLLVFVLRPVAGPLRLLDIPNDRSSHQRPTPLIGGLAMFLASCVGGLAAVANGVLVVDAYSMSLFGGGLLLVLVGAIDDVRELSPWLRFGAQILASLIMIYGGGVVLDDLGNMTPSGDVLYLGWLAVPFTVFATLGVINALNMCDGVDGLSGTLAMISLSGLMIVAFVNGGPVDSVLLALLAASILGFLLFNLRFPGRKQAAVFMGDAGSMFLGFALTWFTISLSQGSDRAMVPAAALWFLMLPIFDTVAMMLRRLMRGRSPFEADREHIHHVFLMAGFTVNETVVVMSAAALIGVGMGLLSMDIRLPEFSIAGMYVICGILYFWMILRSWKVMRFIERSINRRRGDVDRRSGADRRQRVEASFAGPERRSGTDRRRQPRRAEDRYGGESAPDIKASGENQTVPGKTATASNRPLTRA